MRWQQHVAAALVFLGASVAMTWPLAINLGRAVADPGDPWINIWILDWDWWATLHQPLALFHANAFHPAKYALAFSENLYGVAVLLFPLRLFGASAITAYNVAMLCGFAFCGYAAWLLGARLTGSFAAGLAAGVFYAFVPFRFVHLTHVQHVWGGWLPLMLVALLAYAETPTRRRAALFAAAFVMNGLTNIHYFFFGALATAITAALAIPRRAWRDIALAMLVALVVLAPFLYPYAAVAKLYDMQRGWDEVLHFSAMPSDWLPGTPPEPERRLFPGYLACIGVAAALAFARGERAKLLLGGLWVAIGFLGSLGLHFEFHRFLFGAVPGFRAIRAPARWAVIAYIGIAILLAVITAVIARRKRWLAFLVPIALVVELWCAPIRWYMTDPQPPEVHQWLATQTVKGIIELPIDALASEYEAMLHATAHHKPMVNGISGFVPPERVSLSSLSKADPIGDAFVDALVRANVDTIVVHADRMGGRSPAIRDWLRRELDRGRIAFAGRFDSKIEGDWVFRIGGKPAPRPHVLEQFLIGIPTCGDSMIGALDFPDANVTFQRAGMFSGWTFSPHGVRKVDLWFDNRTVRYPAHLQSGDFEDRCPERRDFTRIRFVAVFDKRPANVSRDTDVQVEITDNRGQSIVLDDRWIRWE